MQLTEQLSKSFARYRRAFARARAMRSWRTSLGVAALAAILPANAHSQFPAVFELSSLDGTNGFVLNGGGRYDRNGFAVSDAGDINGDGIDDLIIGTSYADLADLALYSNPGVTYVVFGKTTPFTSVVDLAGLSGDDGFVLHGVDGADRSGASVSRAGDVNGDGIDDIIVGAPLADPGGKKYAGESYVVFGRNTVSGGAGFGAALNLGTLDGTDGFALRGADVRERSGISVSEAGDVNGDGIDDLIIGALFADPNSNSAAGKSYVVFGKETPFEASVELGSLDGLNGFVINGVDPDDRSGRSVSGAGDVNGDGIDDLIIGAFFADPNSNSLAGESYVVFGRDTIGGGDLFAAELDLDGLSDADGFVINGVAPFERSGNSVSGAGDVNGDGIDDLIIGTRNTSPDFNTKDGESYVLFGKTTPFGTTIELSNLSSFDGFVIKGADVGDLSVFSVSGAGDVNGDGIDDLIIGESYADSNSKSEAGKSYVVFGSTTSLGARLDLSGLSSADGFVLNGVDVGDRSGFSVSGAGDVNGDGINDLIIGATGADNFTGASYVIFGRRIPEPTAALLALPGLLAWNPRRRRGNVGAS